MLEKYDPLKTPDPVEWLAADEQERMYLVSQYHVRVRRRPPSPQLHAAIHAIVENQIAMGGEVPARDTLDRLMGEGLDRHEAVHAIGLVMTEHLVDLMKSKAEKSDNEKYFQNLRELTAAKWRRSQAED